jgi:hypothetical protein
MTSVAAAGVPTIDVEAALTIRKPRRDVAAVMFNPRYDTAWIGGLVAVHPVPPGPLRHGTRMKRVSRYLGCRFARRLEVVHHVPERAAELTTQKPFPLRWRYELEGIPEGTITRIRAQGGGTGLLRLASPMLSIWLRRGMQRDLLRLKRLLEAGAGTMLALRARTAQDI